MAPPVLDLAVHVMKVMLRRAQSHHVRAAPALRRRHCGAWGDLLEAIQVHQEIGGENEELKAEAEDLTPLIKVCDGLCEKIDRLEEEYLRQMLSGSKRLQWLDGEGKKTLEQPVSVCCCALDRTF